MIGVRNVKLGAIVTGTVTEIVSYGAFIACEGDTKGLVHISEISDRYVESVADFLKVGQTVCAKVISVDPGNQFLRLSLKQCHPSEKKKKNHHVRIRVPKDEIDFVPLREALPGWIEAVLKDNEEKR